jgi:hypothetical protein
MKTTQRKGERMTEDWENWKVLCKRERLLFLEGRREALKYKNKH